MLDYIFFDAGLAARFIDRLKEAGVEYETQDEEEGMTVSVPEDLDEELTEALDELYDALLDENAEMLEAAEENPDVSGAGVTVQLADGSPAVVPVSTQIMNRLFQVLTPEEVRDLFQSIAQAVENPDTRPLCQISKDR